MHQTSVEKSFYSTGSGLQKSVFLCYRSIVFISAFRAIRAQSWNIVWSLLIEQSTSLYALCNINPWRSQGMRKVTFQQYN